MVNVIGNAVPFLLLHGIAAVDDDRLPGDEIRSRARQEQGGADEVVRVCCGSSRETPSQKATPNLMCPFSLR